MAISLRNSNVEKLAEQHFDVLIVGGGINGAVAAASLAGRGVRVALIDKRRFRRRRQFQLLQPGLGRDQVPREPRVPAGQQAVQVPQPS